MRLRIKLLILIDAQVPRELKCKLYTSRDAITEEDISRCQPMKRNT